MLLPVAPINSWHQVFLALSVSTCPNCKSLFQLCEPVRQYMLSVVVLPHQIYNRIHIEDFCLNSDSKSRNLLLFFVSFYCFLFSVFLEFIFFFFFPTYVFFPSVYSDQQSTAFATIVSEARFRLCRGTYISTLFGVCPTFRSLTTAIIIFFLF